MRNFIDRFISWIYIRRIWGSRCSEVEPNCICCQKWIEHDELFNDIEMRLPKSDLQIKKKFYFWEGFRDGWQKSALYLGLPCLVGIIIWSVLK